MSKIKILKTEKGYKISVNGIDVSEYVTHVNIDLDANRPAVVELTIQGDLDMPEEIEMELKTERRPNEN